MAVTPEQLLAFAQSPAPREVPEAIRKARLRGMLGRVPMLFGLVFGLFGIPFLLLFFPWHAADTLRLAAGPVATAEGEVTRLRKTNISVGGSKHSKGSPVYEIAYVFATPDATRHEGRSYNTGGGPERGRRVTVEYLEGNPGVNRIEGMRLDAMGLPGMFVLLFPLIGLGVAAFTWRARRNAMALLRRGALAVGTVEDVETTGTRVNEKPVYRVTVRFDTPAGERTATYKALGDEVRPARDKQESGDPAGVLYDPDRPTRIFLLDTLLARA